MHNARPHLAEFKLDVHGFRYARHETAMKNFMDADEIKRVYYPEMVELVKADSGAKRVVVFLHTLGTADDAVREEHKIREPVRRAHHDHIGRRENSLAEPVRRAHNDYTECSRHQRLRDLLLDEAEELLKRRFAM